MNSRLSAALGKSILVYRNEERLTQNMFADRAQICRSYLSQIERGIGNPTMGCIARILRVLKMSSNDVLRAAQQLTLSGDATPISLANTNAKLPTALVADDDEDVRSYIGATLEHSGIQVISVNCGFDAIRIVSNKVADVVVSDIRMANGNGMELLSNIRKHGEQLPVFLITGNVDFSREHAMALGAHWLFYKPFDAEDFVTRVNESLLAIGPLDQACA